MDRDAENQDDCPERDDRKAVETLTFKLIVLGNAIGSDFTARVGRHHDISLSQWRCLIWLAAHPGASGRDTAAGTAMDPMNVSRNLRALETKKLVDRSVDATDAKRWRWQLTSKGRRVYDEIIATAESRDRSLVGLFDKAELGALLDAIDRMKTALTRPRATEQVLSGRGAETSNETPPSDEA